MLIVGPLFERALRPRGRFVVIVGPDGAGKTTLSRELARGRGPGPVARKGSPLAARVAAAIRFWETSSPLGPLGPGPAWQGTPGQDHVTHETRLLLAGLCPRTLGPHPARAGRGGIIILERGYWDMYVDPRRYGLAVAPRIVRALGSLVPAPHVSILLAGDPRTVTARRSELTEEETARQMAVWRRLAGERGIHVIDAGLPADLVLSEAAAVVLGGRAPSTSRVRYALRPKPRREHA